MISSFFRPKLRLKCPSGNGLPVSRPNNSRAASCAREESTITPSQSNMTANGCCIPRMCRSEANGATENCPALGILTIHVPRCFRRVNRSSQAKAPTGRTCVGSVRSSGRRLPGRSLARRLVPACRVRRASPTPHRHGGLWLRQARSTSHWQQRGTAIKPARALQCFPCLKYQNMTAKPTTCSTTKKIISGIRRSRFFQGLAVSSRR